MTATISVHGTRTELSGLIVSCNLDASGFETDSFNKENPESMGFTLVVEVADLSQNRLSYLPLKGSNDITSNLDDATGVIPLVRDGSSVETRTVVLQHDALEGTDLFSRVEAVESAQAKLDARAPVKELWTTLRGRMMDVTGVESDGTVFASDIDVSETLNSEASRSDAELAENAEEYLREKFVSHIHDEHWSYQTHISVPRDSILHLRFGVHGDHFETEERIEGTLHLSRRNDWVAEDVDAHEVDKAARAHERRHERGF